VTRHLSRGVLLTAVAVLAVAIAALLSWTGALSRVDDASFDTRLAIRGERAARDDVVVVGVDDTTVNALNLQWPFPRSLHAHAIDVLTAAGAKVIAYDISFAEPTTPFDETEAAAVAAEDNDIALLDAITRSKRVVLAANEFRPSTDGTLEPNIVFLDEDLAAAEATYGNTAWAVDTAFRRLPLTLDGVPSFPVAVAERATGERVSEAGFRDGRAPIDYTQRSLPVIPFSDVVGGSFDADRVRGKVVIVGATASRFGDVHSTPWGSTRPGAEINAQAVASLLNGTPLRDTPGWITAALTLLMGAGVTIAAWRLRPLVGAAVGAALVILLLVAVQVAFNGGHVVALAAPVLAGLVALVGALGVNTATVIRDRRRIRTAFGRFLPPSLVDQVVARAEADQGLAGERRYATVVFADLRGFTTAAETLPPETVIELLNRYLGEVADAVLDAGGTVVSYQGDGVMAVFGAPVEQADHADRALAAVRDIRDHRLPAFNTWATANGVAAPFSVGIGVASGPVMSGTVGSMRRLEYTTVGDTTNAAARLQALSKDTSRTVLVSDATRAALTAPAPDLVAIGALDVRGKQVPASVWTLGEAEVDAG